MNKPKFGECSTCVWLKWADEPLSPNSIGICLYFHSIRYCSQDCKGNYTQAEKAWVNKEEEALEEGKEKVKLVA